MMVIYKDFSGLKVTTEENYNARIRNERKITDCKDFNTPEEIIEFFVKWYGNKPEEFKVIL